MKRITDLTTDEKWRAVAASDKNYDGLFFYGVKTTGIFCKPSCSAKIPRKENVTFFDAADEAVKAGFRPCKKCRPDLLTYDPDRELAERIKGVLDVHFDDMQAVNSLIKEIGISQNHLIRLFKQYFKCTAHQYLSGLRIKKSIHLIGKTQMTILQIALTCGFGSLSNFYKCFKEQTGRTPTEYRKKGDFDECGCTFMKRI